MIHTHGFPYNFFKKNWKVLKINYVPSSHVKVWTTRGQEPYIYMCVTKLRFGWSLLESQYLKNSCWLERKGCFIQEASNLGRRQTHVQKPIPKILLDHESFEKENHLDRLSESSCFPLCADFLLIGWWWRNRDIFQESCAQLEVTILYLGGGLSSPQKNSKVLLCMFLEEEPGPCFISALLFLDCFSFVSTFPPFPD